MPDTAFDIEAPRPTFIRALGPVEGTCIVIGTVLSSGVFLLPSVVAGSAGRFGIGGVLLTWLVAGLLSIAGALAFAELASMFPSAGGQYVFLREAYGKRVAFLFGWTEFWLARPAAIAAVAAAFATAAGNFTHFETEWSIRWTAFLLVFAITVINYLGVRTSGTVQVLLTATKVAALATLAVCAFGLPGGSFHNWGPLFHSPEPGEGGLEWLMRLSSAVGASLLAALWAFNGWTNAAAVSEEMKEPRRDVPRALVLGTVALTLIYLAAALAYHYVLPMADVSGSRHVAADVASVLFGSPGPAIIGIVAVAAAFSTVNGLLLTGPRIFYAMARDGLFFREMAEIHPRFRTPSWAILFQGLWAGFLILVPLDSFLKAPLGLSGPAHLFEMLFSLVVFVAWIFYGLTVAGMVLLRVRRPELERPYRAWGYPIVPLLFVLTSAAVAVGTVQTHPRQSIAGLIVLLLGLPAYQWWSGREAAAQQGAMPVSECGSSRT